MIRRLILTVMIVAATVSACGDEEISDDSGELPMVRVGINELGPDTFEALVEESMTIVQATLSSISEGVAFRSHQSEEEPNAEFIELIGLNFTASHVIKGTALDEVTITWDGYVRDNIGGEPGPRTARIELEGIQFTSDDIGRSFVLFLTELEDNRMDVININDGMARVDDTGRLSPLNVGGLFGNPAREAYTIDDLTSANVNGSGAEPSTVDDLIEGTESESRVE